MLRTLAILASVVATGCQVPPDAQGPAQVIGHSLVFEDAFAAMRDDYVEPIPARDLVRRALSGLASARGLPQPQASQIVAAAASQVAQLPAGDERAMRDRLTTTVDTLRGLPGAPSDTLLLQAALSGMVAGLDTKTHLLTSGLNGLRLQNPAGLGIEAQGERFRINNVLLPSPAADAGVRFGDMLAAVEGHPVAGLALSDINDRLRGPDGSQVALSVVRDGQPLALRLVRGPVMPAPVTAEIVNHAIYVRPSAFRSATGDRTRDRLRELLQTEPQATGVILDLRWNAGGLWSEVLSVAGAFLPTGATLATVKRRRLDADDRPVTTRSDVTGGLPLVVLVDGETASGAEVVVAALQANHRATIMGSPTAGAGSVGTVIPLGDLGVLVLTTGRIMLASGKPLVGAPLKPDVDLAIAPDREDRPGQRVFAPERPSQDQQVLAAARFLSTPRPRGAVAPR